jgi:hypothetical protein
MTSASKITTLLEKVRRGGAYTCTALEAMNDIAAEVEKMSREINRLRNAIHLVSANPVIVLGLEEKEDSE